MNPNDNTTASVGSGGERVDPAEFRALLLEARAVLDAVEALVRDSAGGEHAEWAPIHAEQTRLTYDALVEHYCAGDVAGLTTLVRGITSVGVPMAEAPPELREGADRVDDAADVLAGRALRIFPPLLDDDGFTDSAKTQLAQVLPAVAVELGL